MHPEITRHLKHNLVVNLLDGAFFGGAVGFASFVTVLPLFVSTMTDSAILIGLIPAIHNAGWQLPQLLIADKVARQKRYKPMTILMTTQERLPFLGLAIVAWFLPTMKNQTALLLTFGLLTWQGLGAGLTANPWQSLIAKIIPPNRRGTFFGSQAAIANLIASFSAILAGLILEKVGAPLNFALCFLLAFIAIVISWFFLALTREPESIPQKKSPEVDKFGSNLRAILHHDTNFRWFLVVRMLSQISIMAFAFYTVYAVHHHGLSEIEVGFMTGLLMGTQIVLNPLMGWLGDRWGHRSIMEIGLIAALLSALFAWWAPSPGWYYLVFILTGTANVAIWTIGLAMILEFGSETERPTYIGLGNTLIAPAAILSPILGGWLAEIGGYPATFLASAIAGLTTVIILHLTVRDPRNIIPPAKVNHNNQ